MIVYWYNGVPVDLDLDADILWVLYSSVRKSQMECRIKVKVGKRRIWLDIAHINAEKTFAGAICENHRVSIPPLGDLDEVLPFPPRTPTLPSVGNERDTDPMRKPPGSDE